MAATAAYKRGTPLRANSKAHQEDLATIRKASRPAVKAEQLIKQRTDAELIAKVDAMLFDLQGRRKRYRYDQAAAQQLEHIWPSPFDPHTQMPLWRDLLWLTKKGPTDRDTFMGFAKAILCQFDLFNPNASAIAPNR